ncbi:16S rRNA (guanine(527)-N(7))-methyltransferase RsmG [Novispirillum sp. DQ9]|uniref:16S rRNA (guanine(527)-N(7))-methyltransferase RsmG n=1 Tax=Novispirillum sp. DQ9 TaxID=3398612 RepID=UPI003C7DB00C
MTPEEFQRETGVSRETLDRLQAYADLLVKWQKSINLVGRSTLGDLWRRHMLDSAQLHPLLPEGARTLVDFGSGAGFPAMVLAILGVPDVHMIESDVRKGAFLREVARVTGVPVTVHSKRIEAMDAFPADVVSARALAPVAQLLDFAAPFLGPQTRCLFLKGQNVEAELTEAYTMWKMTVERHPSRTESAASILRLSEVRREPA